MPKSQYYNDFFLLMCQTWVKVLY